MAKRARQEWREGLDGRHRDTTGRIDKKHGNTRIGSLRKTYGEHLLRPPQGHDAEDLARQDWNGSLHAYLRKHHK